MFRPSLPSPLRSPLNALIAPSLLSSDFAHLATESNKILSLGANWLHVDVMDGHFVPNLTLGAPIVKCLRKHVDAYLDCHIMTESPEKWVDDFSQAGADGFCFHVEAVPPGQINDLCKLIRRKGMRAGLALRPSSPLEKLMPHIDAADMVLIMTVEPGFGGQKFMSDQMHKIEKIRKMNPHLIIQVDGGLSPETVDHCTKAGANCIVAGSAIFGSKDPADVIKKLRESVQQYAIKQ